MSALLSLAFAKEGIHIFQKLLYEIIKNIGWALIGAISMSLSLGILLKIFDWMTPIKEWEEIKKGNVCVAIILASAIIAFGFVVGMAIHGT